MFGGISLSQCSCHDFSNRDASTGAESATASYDLLIGGDGASSGVRAAMMDQVPGMKVRGCRVQ